LISGGGAPDIRTNSPDKGHAAVEKAPDAFRTISEVAEELDIPQHVLRFWESRFPQIKPMKRAGGRRYYRPDDVDLLRGIRHLLYGEGYTIRGVQRILKEQGQKFVQAVWQPGAAQPGPHAEHDSFEEAGQDPTEDADGEPAPPHSASSLALGDLQLSGENVRRLETALHELRECRRVLDHALNGEAT
jgi:DNA-binding transcriptional MerR regulator